MPTSWSIFSSGVCGPVADRAHILDGLDWRHGAVPLAVLVLSMLVAGAIVGPPTLLAGLISTLLVGLVVVVAWSVPAAIASAANLWRGGIALALVAAVFIVDLLILSLPRVGSFAALQWNWQGKTLDLVWCLGVIALLSPARRREIGWTFTTRPGSLPVAFINIAILAAAGFLVVGFQGGLTTERVLFDITYPNLVEEIIFRGFMLALLDRAFGTRWTFAGAQIGWGVVLTAWLFGLAHGVALDAEGAVAFDPTLLVITFVAGLVFGWIRALTGSLWPAWLAHTAPEVGILLALALA